MRQVAVTGPGGPEVLQLASVPLPQPGAGDVLIRVAAAGVNRPDLSQRAGTYPPPPGASPVLGLEVAGTVAQLGPDVSGWRVGDALCALVPGGGYSEFVVAPAAHCLPVPRGLTLTQAAALPETAFTVWSNVFDRARLCSGEYFLVHAGSSGIGTMAIQIAAARGAHVLTTAGGPEKCNYCKALGAEVAIDYHAADFVEVVLEVTQQRGVDVILDMVGGDYFARNLKSLATDGRLVNIAFLKGNRVELDLNRVMRQRLTVTGSTLRPRSVADKAAIAEELLLHVWPLIEAGRVRAVIHKTWPLEQVREAHAELERGQHMGKIVLVVE